MLPPIGLRAFFALLSSVEAQKKTLIFIERLVVAFLIPSNNLDDGATLKRKIVIFLR